MAVSKQDMVGTIIARLPSLAEEQLQAMIEFINGKASITFDDDPQPDAKRPRTAMQTFTPAAPVPLPPAPAVGGCTKDTLHHFAAENGLDGPTTERLMKLSDEELAQVTKESLAGTRNPNAVVHGRIKKMRDMSSWGAVVAVPPPPPPPFLGAGASHFVPPVRPVLTWSGPGIAAGGGRPSAGGYQAAASQQWGQGWSFQPGDTRSVPERAQEYSIHHSLDERVTEMLSGLSAYQLDAVVQKELSGARNPSAVIAKRAAEARSGNLHPADPGAYAQALQTPPAMATATPTPTQYDPNASCAMSVEEYAQKHGLDADTQTQLYKLQELNADAVGKVMQRSLDGARNPNAVVTKRCVEVRTQVENGTYQFTPV